jgi:integrase
VAPKSVTPPRHADMRHMEIRYRTYFAVLSVPRPLRPKVGKAKLLRSLKTDDYRVARARLNAALGDLQKHLEPAREVETADKRQSAALAWRDTFQRLEGGDVTRVHVTGPDGKPITDPHHLRSEIAIIVDEQAEDIEAERGADAAALFSGVAYGTATPLLLHVDDWLKEGGAKGPLNGRTKNQYRADVERFAAWAQTIGVSTVEGVTEGIAGRYVTAELVAKGVHPGTGNRRISACSAYWRWLRKRAGVKAQPWAEQSLAKVNGRHGHDDKKRPFTDNEVSALLAGAPDPELADAMRIAALSGMRLEEIYRLTIADCAGGWFRVGRSKTAAGVRRVPVHPDVAEIVARRLKDKARDDFLFHEAGAARDGRERSAAISKRFGRYRQSVGVHDRADGVRHSRVDFHSWRRWFITRARNAGTDRAVVVGHETGSITDDVYSRVGDNARIACVTSVRLP